MAASPERQSPGLRNPVPWTLQYYGTLESVTGAQHLQEQACACPHVPVLTEDCFRRVMLSIQSSSMVTTTTSAPLAGSSSACRCRTSWSAWGQWPTAIWWSLERGYAMITYNIFSAQESLKCVFLIKGWPEMQTSLALEMTTVLISVGRCSPAGIT